MPDEALRKRLLKEALECFIESLKYEIESSDDQDEVTQLSQDLAEVEEMLSESQ